MCSQKFVDKFADFPLQNCNDFFFFSCAQEWIGSKKQASDEVSAPSTFWTCTRRCKKRVGQGLPALTLLGEDDVAL